MHSKQELDSVTTVRFILIAQNPGSSPTRASAIEQRYYIGGQTALRQQP